MPEYVKLRAPAEHSNPINMDLFRRIVNRIRLLCICLADRLQLAAICRIASKGLLFRNDSFDPAGGRNYCRELPFIALLLVDSIEISTGLEKRPIGERSLIGSYVYDKVRTGRST
jgi:hypothetical protein